MGHRSASSLSDMSAISKEQKVDVQGVLRGACSSCMECPQFLVSLRSRKISCEYCGCAPTKHANVQFQEEEQEDDSDGVSDSDYETDRGQKEKRKTEESNGVKFELGKWRLQYQENEPPHRVKSLLAKEPACDSVAKSHTWSSEDTSPNIYVKEDDPFTCHRNSVQRITDAIRGRGLPARGMEDHENGSREGYTSGLHVWEVVWPRGSRGTHPVVGVATRECPLTCSGYKRLVGSTSNSWGWCLKSLRCYHDSEKYRKGVPYPKDIDKEMAVPSLFLMILDMDKGTLAFQVEDDYLGVAFCGLRGKELYPIVSVVWGCCEVSLTLRNKHMLSEPES